MSNSSKQIALTGATGYVGGVLVRKLLAQGYRVRALLRQEEAQDLPRDEALVLVRGDLTDISSLRELAQGCDAFFHLASHISISRFDDQKLIATNIQGTQNVVTVCKERAIRLVYVSSIEAIGKQGEFIHSERESFVEGATLIRYGWSKALASKLVLKACAEEGLDGVIICPTGIIGPFDNGRSRLGSMVDQFIKHKLPAYPARGGFCFVDVRDVADAVIAAFYKGQRGQHYIVSAGYLAIKDMMALLEKISGVPKPRWAVPLPLMSCVAFFLEPLAALFKQTSIFTQGTVNVLKSELNVESIKLGELGIKPRPLEQSFSDEIRWRRGEKLSID